MLDSHPRTSGLDVGVLAATTDAPTDCAQACTADIDADLGEQDLAAAGVVSRLAEYDANVARPLLEACVAICTSCGDECERHARHFQHCRVCAEACGRCEQACREFLDVVK
jgi:hypothetical protein